MTVGMLFWMLMILCLVYGFVWYGRDPSGRFTLGDNFLLWFLLFLLGWKLFGFIIQN